MRFIFAITSSICSLGNQNDLGKLLICGHIKTVLAMGVSCVHTCVRGSAADGQRERCPDLSPVRDTVS